MRTMGWRRRTRALGAAAGATALLAASGAGAERVALANGDVLEVDAVERTDSGWTLHHPVLGTLTLAAEGVSRVGAETPAAAPEPVAPSDTGAFGAGLLVGFERSLSLGVTGARGNSESTDATLGLDLDFADEERRWDVSAYYGYAEDDSEVTRDHAFLDVTRDWLRPGLRRFYFAQLRWDMDQLEDWDHRGSLAGGVGFRLVERAGFELRARTGLAATRTFGGAAEETDFELLLRVETEWRPSEAHKVTAYNALYPSLKDAGELRNRTGIAWRADLAGSEGLALQLRVENEYESDVPLDTERNDLKYDAALVYDF